MSTRSTSSPARRRRTTDADARQRLTLDAVLGEALAIADRDGLDALTMRTLAEALGVQAMSLYHHVANKDALLDALVERVFAEVVVPEPAGRAWRAPIRTRMVSLHDALGRHPWAMPVLESRTSPGPVSLQHHDALLAVLRAGGFSIPNALLAFAVLDAYVFGFVVQEQALPFADDPAADADVVAGFAAMATHLPNLAEAIVHVGGPGWRFSDQFEPGLDLVLDAVAVLGRRRRQTT